MDKDEKRQFISDAGNVVQELREHIARMGTPSPSEREMLSKIKEMLHELKAILNDMKPKS